MWGGADRCLVLPIGYQDLQTRCNKCVEMEGTISCLLGSCSNTRENTVRGPSGLSG